MPATAKKAGRERYVPTVTRPMAEEIAGAMVEMTSLKKAGRYLEELAPSLPDRGRGSWRYYVERYAWAFKKGRPGGPLFSTKGNEKLPFTNWSTLPGFSCPGAGECLQWCYSFKAWRYPAAFFRQVQGTLFTKLERGQIEGAFLALPSGITLRLFVDGDFASVDEVAFWMGLVARRPDLSVYSYSKSWCELVAYDKAGGIWPTNYKLNISSGGKARSATADDVRRLPITRGDFMAIPVDYEVAHQTAGHISNERFDDPEYHRAVRKAAADQGLGKVFSCPGKCGSCVRGGHACGLESFYGVKIVIGIH